MKSKRTLKSTVIIPVWNRKELIQKTLDGLFNQSRKADQIIVVDDHSTDGTYELLKSYSGIQILQRQGDFQSSSASRNQGIESAEGDVILFTDSDVVCPDDWIQNHMEFHENGIADIVQGQLIRVIRLEEMGRRPYSPVHYSRAYFDCANVSVNAEKLRETDGFDTEVLPHSWEDLELGYRLLKKGARLKRMHRKGAVWHFEGHFDLEGMEKYYRKRYREGWRALDYYRKWPVFEVQMMTMIHPFYFGLSRLLYRQKKSSPEYMVKKIAPLIESGRDDRAVAEIRWSGFYHYFLGLSDRISREGIFIDS